MGCRVGEENATLDKSMNKQRETISRKAGLIKIAIEMDLESYRVVRQIDGSAPQPAQKFSPEGFLAG
jgi:hypothetical protein